MRFRADHLVVAIAALLAPRAALAAGEHARLVYAVEDAGGTCPSEAAFRAKVTSRLGYDPFRDDAALSVRVRIVTRGGAASAEISAVQDDKPAGKRSLQDPRCDALGDTAASAVAILLDPLGTGAPPDAAPLPVPPPSEAVPPPNLSAPPVRETPAPSEPEPATTPLVYADFIASFARTPAAMLGGRLGIGASRGAWSVALEGRAETSPSDAAIGTRDHIEASAISGALAPCRALASFFQLCGVVTLGSREVKSLDVVQPGAKSAFFAEIGVRAGLELPLSRVFALRANGELGIPLLRTTYTTDGLERSTTSIIEGSLGTGLVGRFR